MLQDFAITTLLLPAAGALLAGLVGLIVPASAERDRFAMLLTSGIMVACAAMALVLFNSIALQGADPLNIRLFTWLTLDHTVIDFGLLVDKLTATMLLVVCGVSACVHVYSIGYMQDDPAKPRFFALLSFFTFTMLTLVTAPNLLQMFLGWEGVGVASYLLIGFWHHKESATAAGMKAFITNRVADAVMLVGLFTLLVTFGTLDYVEILHRVGDFNATHFEFMGWLIPVLELAAFCLVIGAMGKSAQFGFHVWLPDAMEGPTPVSALIHAATMVTAGVFLLCRMSPLLEMAPQVLTFVGYAGALTALFAATVGLTQRDIKRVIAYSTCSQLGYMFFAIGVGAYPAAMFHLTTHAFFKALLFLGAGSVIHGLHHEQDLFKMGGVRLVFPVTYALMWIGSLALAGIPPFAGFFSKDLILESAFAAHDTTGMGLYMVGTVGALLTAFYSFRVVFLAFHGGYKGGEKGLKGAHESPWIMLAPMMVLAVGAVLGGWLLHDMADAHWWAESLALTGAGHPHVPALVKYAPLALALLGMALAGLFYLKRPMWPAKMAAGCPRLYRFSLNKWYVDELWQVVLIRPLRRLAQWVWQVGDVRGIDGLGPNGVAHVVFKTGQWVRRGQTGFVFHYALAVAVGLCLMVTYLLWL